MSLDLATSMGLPDHPPSKPNTILTENTFKVDINYENEMIFHDTRRVRREIPYLGNILELSTLTPLETFPAHREYSLSRVFKGLIENKNYYICIFSDKDLRKIILYSDNGKKLKTLDLEYKEISHFGNYILCYAENEFQLYEITRKDIRLIGTMSTNDIAHYLQMNSPKSIKSNKFGFSDFKFCMEDGGLIIWAFNVTTTAYLPDFLHIKFSYRSLTARPNVIKTFGLATKADRLPLNSRAFKASRIDDRFWVPRSNDAQLDVYRLNGALVKTVVLPPIDPNIATGGDLRSPLIQKRALSDKTPQDFFSYYTMQNFISSVITVGNFILVSRVNYKNTHYQIIYTLLNKNGDIIADDFCAQDLLPIGSSLSEVFSLNRFEPDSLYLPRWLVQSKKFNQEKLDSGHGWWLTGFQVKEQSGYEEAPPAQKNDNALPNEISGAEISPKLKRNLLKAKQLRNVLSLEGFVKLSAPSEYGLREMTDVVFLDGCYFVIDGPGRQFLQFDENGVFIRPISRGGDGPAEFQRPQVLTRIFDNQLALIDTKSILIFRSDGVFVKKINGLSELGLSVGGNQIIWQKQDRLFIGDANPPRPTEKQHAIVTFSNNKFKKTGFGDRFHLWDKKFANHYGHISFSAFAKIGDHIWSGSPYNASVEIYDLNGSRLKEIESSHHPGGIIYSDFEEQTTNQTKKRFFQKFIFQKISNYQLHQLGSVAIRTLLHPTKFYIYDIYDLEGRLLVRNLDPGASPIYIFDTFEKRLIGKLTGLDQIALTQSILEKRLYKPEMKAFFEAGFDFQAEDDGHYLWIAKLAD